MSVRNEFRKIIQLESPRCLDLTSQLFRRGLLIEGAFVYRQPPVENLLPIWLSGCTTSLPGAVSKAINRISGWGWRMRGAGIGFQNLPPFSSWQRS